MVKEEINKIEKIYDNLKKLSSTEDLTEEEQSYLDNFPHIFAQAILFDFCPDTCKQIINHLSKMLDDGCDFLDEYVKVVRCGCCKWWKDSRCTNVNGAYNNTVLNPDWFCRSGQEVD